MIDETTHRQCSRCGVVKLLEGFPAKKECRQGRGTICKACKNKYRRDSGQGKKYALKWSRSRPEENRRRVREWAKKNPKRQLERCRRWRENNRENEILS